MPHKLDEEVLAKLLHLNGMDTTDANLKALANAVALQVSAEYETKLSELRGELLAAKELLASAPRLYDDLPGIATLWPKSKRVLDAETSPPDSAFAAMLDSHRTSFAKAWAYETSGSGGPLPAYAQSYAFMGWWMGRELLKNGV